MKQSAHVRGKQKLQLGALAFLCLIGGLACGESGPSTELDTESPDTAGIRAKSAGPRREVCWKGKSRLKEIELQKLRKVRYRKLECNLITRRTLARKKEILAMN